MKKNWQILLVGVIVIVAFIIGFIFLPLMPEEMASHWNVAGQADGYMSRTWGIFLMPLVILGMSVFLLLIPLIDPLKANIQKFRSYYDWFVVLILLFMLYIYVLTLLWNKGLRFDFTQLLIPAFGILFFFIGVMTGKAKRNYFIGIRTPWTLNNDEVWDRTHRLGGLLFRIAGVIVLLTVFLPGYAMHIMGGLVLGIVILLVVYSYVVYQKIAAS